MKFLVKKNIPLLKCLILLLSLSACPQQMATQPRLDPLEAYDFFPRGMASQTPVKDTVARGLLNEDVVFSTGKNSDGTFSNSPLPQTSDLVARGQERFNINCRVCHGTNGRGDGIVVQKGFLQPPDFLSERLLQMPDGQIFETITNGFRAMPPYRYQVSVADRWAIVAYVRALQNQAHATPESESKP